MPVLQKLYVGNLTWTTNEDTLRQLFGAHGEVNDAFIIRDKLTGNSSLIGKSRGFGFVEFGSKDEAEKAMQELDGTQSDGRTLRVNLADEKPARGPRREEF